MPALAARVAALLSAAALLAGISPAQTTSTITGTVRDQTGGVVAGATVTVRQAQTGLVRTEISDQEGRFVVPALPVGSYELRAEAKAFRPILRKGVQLTVGRIAVVDFHLEVGQVDQEITVTAEASPVNTGSAELSYLVPEQAIRELPLNGRNYIELAFLQPGVVSYPHRDTGSVVAHGVSMSVNGQDPRANLYLLDGTPMNDFTNGPAGSAAGTALGTETIQEFRVETNAYSAEFGRNFGGQVNILTKSGSNALHGSLYHFHRNDNLDARDFFDAAKPEFKRNQAGATLGGPIRTDKAFFFVGYEALRERRGRTILTFVPDLDARRGLVNGRQYQIDPLVRPYLEEYPTPNGPSRGGGIAEYRFGFKQQLDEDFAQARYDHHLSGRHQFFVRYTVDDAAQRLPTDYPQFPRTFLSRNQFITAEFRQILSPETLNTVRLGFSRTRIGQAVESLVSQPLTAFVPGRGMIGNIDVGGLLRFGPQTSVNVKLVQNVYGVEEGLVLHRGHHLIRLGALIERYQDNMVNPTFGLGIFNFGGIPEFLENRPLRFIGLRPDGALDRYWRFSLPAFYAQDDFRVHPRLTVNVGVRYEFSTQPKDIYGRDSALLNLTDPAPAPGQLYRNPTYKNISPRLGLAWDVFGDGRTSLRAGYGWYFNTNNQQNLIVTVTNPPATPRIVIANPTFPVPPFERGAGNTMRPVEWNLKNPNVHVWNMNIQRQLWADTLVTIGYA
ncbi:MAG: TonB-dependent receptor, partial [Acidobacteria bacterium]|nr:TonB-dependent receptor [Acidobacteriota bacterium]